MKTSVVAWGLLGVGTTVALVGCGNNADTDPKSGSESSGGSAGSTSSSGGDHVESGGLDDSGGNGGSGGTSDSGGRDTGGAEDSGGSGGVVGTGGSAGSVAGSGGVVGTGGSAGSAAGSGGSGGVSTGGDAGSPTNTAGAASCDRFDTIRLDGNQILDTSGTRIVARGPEMVVASPDQTAGIDAAAGMGANAARFLLTLDAANGMTPEAFDAVLTRAAEHHMIVWLSLFTWNDGEDYAIGEALGGGNFYSLEAPSGTGTCSNDTPIPCYLAVWSRQWLQDLIVAHESNVIVDAMQEYIGDAAPDSEDGRAEWASAAQTNIQWFRSTGYTVPLEIMSNFEGRDLYAIVDQGADIVAIDTHVVDGTPQTLFGWQAYWGTDDGWYPEWQGGLLLGEGNTLSGAEAIHQFAVTQAFPIQIGFDNLAGDTNEDYLEQMNQAAEDNASWLWWSWSFNDNTVECPASGTVCQEAVTNSETGFAGAVASRCGS